MVDVTEGIYQTGTVSIENGSDQLTGVGTFWLGVGEKFDEVYLAGQRVLVKSIEGDGAATLAMPWDQPDVANVPYVWSYRSQLRIDPEQLQPGIRNLVAFYKMGGVRGTREVTTATDTIVVDDLNKAVVFNRPTAIAVSIAEANAGRQFVDGWASWFMNRNAGTATITPVAGTINGQPSLPLAQGSTAFLWSHDGNYLAAVFRIQNGDDGADGSRIFYQAAAPSTASPAGSLWLKSDSARLRVFFLTGSPLAWADTGVDLRGADGADGSKIFRQAGAPSTANPAGSLWLKTDTARLRLYFLTGEPLAWADTGIDLKGADGADGTSAFTVVRVASLTNVAVANGLENGDTVDGKVLATNDLVLLAGQTAPAENGVYVVPASGAASRQANFNTYDAHCGRYFSVMEGTLGADKLYRCTSDKGGTLGTTALTIAEFSAGRDSDRQNDGLNLIYQSKLLGDVRRVVNAMATGFKAASDALRGINTGASLNVDTQFAAASGYVQPQASNVASIVANSTTNYSPGYTVFDTNFTITNGITIVSMGAYMTTAKTITLKIAKRNSAGNYDVVVSQAFNHPGGGWADVALGSPYVVPGSGTFYGGYYTGAATVDVQTTGNRTYKAGDITGTGQTGFSETTDGAVPSIRLIYGSSNMTLVTAPQTSDANVSNARVLVEIDDTVNVTPDGDITAEVTCNGMVNWHAAALLPTGKLRSQAGRRMLESGDIACTAGNSFAARIKTLTNKNVPVHGVKVEVH